MLLRYLLPLLLLGWTSCGSSESANDPFTEHRYTPRHATSFAIDARPDGQSTLLRVRNPWQGAEGIERQLLILRNGEEVPDGYAGEILHGEPRRIVCMSSSHVAMLDRMEAVDRVVGVSGIDFITNPAITEHRDRVADVGYDTQIDYERLVAAAPDLVLLYGVGSASSLEQRLKASGIASLYIGEYLEQSPLAKAEWLVLLGEVIGRRADAETIFDGIEERYNALCQIVAERIGANRPKVMLNTPYGDSWFMPSAESYIARLIADAGGDYVYPHNTENRSVPVDIEEAYLMTVDADVWLTSSCHTLNELRQAVPKFTEVRPIREGRVWNSVKRSTPMGGNDIWESGVVRPERILRDLIHIFHPEIIDEEPYYYLRLE